MSRRGHRGEGNGRDEPLDDGVVEQLLTGAYAGDDPELVALGRRGSLDPLQAPERRIGSTGEDEAPARQPALLRFGIE